MDVLRERECKDTIERQLADERKLRGKSSIFLSIYLHATRVHVSPGIQIEMFKCESMRQLASLLIRLILSPNNKNSFEFRNIGFQFAFNRIYSSF